MHAEQRAGGVCLRAVPPQSVTPFNGCRHGCRLRFYHRGLMPCRMALTASASVAADRVHHVAA